MNTPIIWRFNKGSRIQAPLTFTDHYVISHRPREFNISYRPPGRHHHVGCFTTLTQAKAAVQGHMAGLLQCESKAVNA